MRRTREAMANVMATDVDVSEVDSWISTLNECKQLSENDVKKLTEQVLRGPPATDARTTHALTPARSPTSRAAHVAHTMARRARFCRRRATCSR